jgi:IS30 family transposase
MIGPLPTAPGGFNRVLVAIDKFTKWIEVKLVTCPKADRVLDFLDELVHRYGLPHHIITDLGSNFNNHQFWEYCENSGIDIRYVSVAHPRANGQVERANGMVLDALKKWLHDTANTKGGTTQCSLGAMYSTLQVNGTISILLGLWLRSNPPC